MQDSTGNKIRQDRNNANEVEVPQPLALLGIIVLDNTKVGVVQNGDVLIDNGKSVSPIKGASELKALFVAISQKCAKIG